MLNFSSISRDLLFSQQIHSMKRGFAIFLLLVANITLLVHAAVPHHNDEGIFCFITTGCESECADHEQESQHKHHQHKHHGDHGDLECELKPIVIIPSDVNTKQEIAVIELNHLPMANVDVNQDLENNSTHYLNHLELKRKIPLKLALFRIFINNSTGLRAPPSFV